MTRFRLWLAFALVATTAMAADRTSAPAAPAAEKPPATVGGKGGEPTGPVKAVEEPVFQLPELVIVGENQARIMAQKEQLTATPLKGLHEAPLLEKEEGSVMALRQREPAPGRAAGRTGTHVLLKGEAGTAGWMAGAGWLGQQQEHGFRGMEISGSRLTGAPVGLGHAGGWDAAARFSGGHALIAPTRTHTGFERLVNFGMRPDVDLVAAGLSRQSRDLPFMSVDAQRRFTRVWATADSSEQPADTGHDAIVEFGRVQALGATTNGFRLGGSYQRPVWSRDALRVRVRAAFDGELADKSGTHERLGARVLAEWVPGERLRGEAGANLEGVFGGGGVAKSARPVGGLSYTLPTGPTISARFAPELVAPWFTRAAAENPYAVFSRQLVPERELANAEVAAWQDWSDGTRVRGAVRFTEARNAATWVERPGQGLWEPDQVPGLRTRELELRGAMPIEVLGSLMPGSRWAVTAVGAWRTLTVTTSPGVAAVRMANVPRAQGAIGLTAAWRTVAADLSADVVRWRPRTSAAGPAELRPYMDLGIGATWTPVTWGQAFARVSNLAGADVERWGGYPEPKALARAGVMLSF